MTTTPEAPVRTEPPTCLCGREIKRINPDSPRPTCVGCGLPPEQCTCTPDRAGGGVTFYS